MTVVEFMPQLLPGLEPEWTLPVARGLQKLGVEVLLNSKAKVLPAAKDGLLSVTIETPEGVKTIEAEKILLSVGRAPITKDLGLEAAGIRTDAKGHIQVNASFQTEVPNIYAAGDVVGPPYLAHKASREAIVAALTIAGFPGEKRGIVPWAVFTDPEIASVGETETEAKARGGQVLVGRFPFAASGRAQAVREPEGFVKVIADKETHRLLGAGIVGPNASDLIGEAVLGALKLGATVEVSPPRFTRTRRSAKPSWKPPKPASEAPSTSCPAGGEMLVRLPGMREYTRATLEAILIAAGTAYLAVLF